MSKKNLCCLCDMPFTGGVAYGRNGVCYICLTTCIGLLNREVVVPIPDLSWDDVKPDIQESVIHTLLGEDKSVQRFLDRACEHQLGKSEERLKVTKEILVAARVKLTDTCMPASWATFPRDRSEFVYAVLISGFRRHENNATQARSSGLLHYAGRCQEIARAHLAAARRLGWAGMPMPS